ncbi:dipeptide ABC transporter ATP-binding protein [Actinophytocola sp.]|uniref:dipeptide ABC transporter ATP-binding protein n=1 Tax=Actinophytocola sp. TaxID=1872138 RepID=UPI00389AB906
MSGARGADDQVLAPVLEVDDLDVSFPGETGRVRAVRGLSYVVNSGEVLGIVGESGSGKSVSSLAVMGLLPENAAVSGSIRFRGQELLGLSDKRLSAIRGRRVAMVFQDPLSALTPVFTVGDQVAEALRTHDRALSTRDARRRAVELLDLVGIPDAPSRARAYPHEFSGGMRQRVVIAMAIACDPDLIIADEPTTALDVTVQAQVLDVLRTARDVTGASVVLITHDLGVVAGFADRVMVMYAGRAVETGPTDAVYAHPRMPYTLGLLRAVPRLDAASPLVPIDGQPPSLADLPTGCPFAPRCPLVVDACREVEPALSPVADGQYAACIRAEEVVADELVPTARRATVDRQDRRIVLSVRDLTKTFPITRGSVIRRRAGTVHAVNGIGFDIAEGETLGLVGESGCGKTTTLMEILGMARPQAGRVEILGRTTHELDKAARKALRADVQVVFQDPVASLDPRLPVADIIAEPLQVHGHDKAAIRARVAELLDLVGLRPEHARRFPAEFSGGQRQRVGIARALALQPKILILDEPVSALDVSIQAGVINLLDELKAKLGVAYLFVSHDLSVVRHIADRAAVMYLGRIVEIGAAEALFTAPLHPYTQALLSAVPIPDPPVERRRERIVLTGDLPNPAHLPAGCPFHTRCFRRAALPEADRAHCVDKTPELVQHGTDHDVACHYA